MQDETGLEYSTSQPETIEHFNQVLAHYLASSVETMPALEQLLEQAPDMPMALLIRAYLLKTAADPRFRAPLKKCFDALLKLPELNDREQRHLHALSLWQADQMSDAAANFDAIVRDYPRDMLALRIAHYLHLYGEGGHDMLVSLSPALQSWHPGDRYYGFLKGMHSFALEESGQYAKAEAAGFEALEINRQDIWAAHAVAHVYQMQSRFKEGIPFIQALVPEWNSANNFVNHLHWHQALQHIGLGEPDAALGIFDELLVKPLADDFYLDVCNASSLLWRLEMSGINISDRWHQLHDLSVNRITDDELVFTSLHYLMAPAILGDSEATETGLNNFHIWANADTTQGKIAKLVGVPMANAIAKLASNKKQEGAKLLQSVRADIYKIGGSHAQRSLFDHLISSYS